MENFGKIMIVVGVLLAIAGIFLVTYGKIPFIGKLPGDIAVKGKNYSFYFPLATSLVLSIILSLIMYLVRRFF